MLSNGHARLRDQIVENIARELGRLGANWSSQDILWSLEHVSYPALSTLQAFLTACAACAVTREGEGPTRADTQKADVIAARDAREAADAMLCAATPGDHGDRKALLSWL